MIRRTAFFFFMLGFLLACRQEHDAIATVAAGTPITIDAPPAVAAGEPVEVMVRLPAPNETAVTLLWSGSYGPRLFQARVRDGQAAFFLEGGATQQAGSVTLVAAAGEARGRATLEIVPGTAVDPVTPLVGARSIIADGAHWAMVIAVPHDQFGNPVAEGTPVEFRAQHPDGGLETIGRPVRHLLAWQRLWSGTVAGRTAVAAAADGRFGPEKELLEIPGWPQPFTLSVDSGPLIADGRQLVTLRSSLITDKFGNAMPDGTQVSFVVQGADGQRLIPAVTLDGVAEAVLQAPDTPQILTVRGSVFGVSSQVLLIRFAAGVQPSSVTVRTRLSATAGVVELEAGPLLGTLSQFVPDGTVVRFVVTRPDEQEQTIDAVSEAGMARAALRLDGLPAGTYQVTAAVGGAAENGRFTIQPVPLSEVKDDG